MQDRGFNKRTNFFPPVSPQGMGRRGLRQRLAMRLVVSSALFLGLTACGDPARDLAVGTVGFIPGFAGAVVADEPRAGLVGRDILTAGGSAADAAVAMAFTMSATLPSSVGIGGGGLCVVHDNLKKETEILDFLPPPAEVATAGAFVPGLPVAVPALPRGMFALHAKAGLLRWEAVVSPAENIARFGDRVSRSLSRELQGAQASLSQEARAIFTRADGQLAGEGALLTQVDLAAVLGRLRQRGPGDLYGGTMGQQFVEAVRLRGGAVTLEGMRAYTPRWHQARVEEIGNHTLYLPPPNLASTQDSLSGMGEIGGASFVVADRFGSAVACSFTLNGSFGTGAVAPGLGFFIAQPPERQGQSLVALTAGVMVNLPTNTFRLGVAASGDGAEASAARLAAGVTGGGADLPEVMGGLPGRAGGGGLVNAISCPLGIPSSPGSCSVAVDPRGAGYGLVIGGS